MPMETGQGTILTRQPMKRQVELEKEVHTPEPISSNSLDSLKLPG